jgi:hypothetical protein
MVGFNKECSQVAILTHPGPSIDIPYSCTRINTCLCSSRKSYDISPGMVYLCPGNVVYVIGEAEVVPFWDRCSQFTYSAPVLKI